MAASLAVMTISMMNTMAWRTGYRWGRYVRKVQAAGLAPQGSSHWNKGCSVEERTKLTTLPYIYLELRADKARHRLDSIIFVRQSGGRGKSEGGRSDDVGK